MNVTELSQVQVDREDASVALMHLLAVEEADRGRDPLWPTIKILIGKATHPLGFHTWVRWRHYDAASNKVLDMNGVICTFCPKARLR